MPSTFAATRRLKADEFVTGEKPGKPLPQIKGLKVRFLAAS
jgi:hypothetical protein